MLDPAPVLDFPQLELVVLLLKLKKSLPLLEEAVVSVAKRYLELPHLALSPRELVLHLVLFPVLELALVDALEQLISLVLEGALGKSSVKTLGRSTRGDEVARS